MAEQAVADLKNIGEKTAVWLNQIGVHTKADLEQMGAVEAYWLIQQQRGGTTAVLLYALYGALHDLHWNALSQERKEILRQQAKQLHFS